MKTNLEQSVYLIILVVLGALGMSLLFSIPVMLLWDWIMPILFGLPEITWMQSWGLLMLCGLLFKDSGVKFNKD